MLKRIINNLVLFNKWIDSSFHVLFIFLMVATPNFLIMFGYLFTGLSIYFILGILAIIRLNIQNGNFGYDKSIYKNYEEGDVLVLTKNFDYWGASNMVTSGEMTYQFYMNDEVRVEEIIDTSTSWIYRVHDSKGGNFYFDHSAIRNITITKVELRDKKLKKLLKK